MKIILLPIFKFIFAIFLTIMAITPTLILLAINVLLLIWNFKWDDNFLTFKLKYGESLPFSPYSKVRVKFGETLTFKTIYHYIWNIK